MVAIRENVCLMASYADLLTFLRYHEPLIAWLGFGFAIFSIGLLFYVEKVRRPSLIFPSHRDRATSEDIARKNPCVWHHLKVQNKLPHLFNRDSALSTKVTVEFSREDGKTKQITARWANQPVPQDDYPKKHLVSSRVASCQRMDIGFREEPFDFLLKFHGRGNAFAADPWVVCNPELHPNPLVDEVIFPLHEKWEELRLNPDHCKIKVEVEAINLGKRKVVNYLLRIGEEIDDVEAVLQN